MPRLPVAVPDALSTGILEAIEMDRYCVEKQAAAEDSASGRGGGNRPSPIDGGVRSAASTPKAFKRWVTDTVFGLTYHGSRVRMASEAAPP
jgi:hypothetical protein